MNMLSKEDFLRIRNWVYRNARQLELARWKFFFENGSKEDVIKALEFYQNEDGGFGNTIEPDNWNPNSTPYGTLHALKILLDIDGIDVEQPMIQKVITYLDQCPESDENGWFFNIPSNDLYPHAPWWTYDEEANKFESIGVTAGIIDFILRYADKDTRLYQRAYTLADKLIHRMYTESNFGEMGVSGYCILRNIMKLVQLDVKYDMEQMNRTIHELVNAAIERDSSKWIYHCKTPQDFITSMDSEFYTENVGTTQLELDYLIEHRNEQGVWDINWSWFDNNEKYAKEFAVSENWWKAIKAIDTLLYLRNFGRLEM